MEIIDNLSKWLVGIIVSGSTLRVAYCAFRLMGAEDEAPMYKKRLRNALIMAVVALSIYGIKDLIIQYFK
ncbi:mercury transporter [Eubacteriales bacterium OttesenSCG-928-M02]|nr:mercury transporter [Eubacteriales bacterium OttesenSCG-928-M02]